MLGILFDVLRNRLSLASASVGIIDNIIHGALFAPPLTVSSATSSKSLHSLTIKYVFHMRGSNNNCLTSS